MIMELSTASNRDILQELQSRNQLGASEAGLYEKFMVVDKRTGDFVPGSFVLVPGRDKAARQAIRRYAEVTDNTALANDLLAWADALNLIFGDED